MQPSFGPVGPINVLEELHKTDDLGDYHLVLSHDVLKHSTRFQKLFGKSQYHYATIIVDNSVIELGSPLDPDSIRRAGDVFKRVAPYAEVVIVLPDVLLDCDATIRVTTEALNSWAKYRGQFRFMFVPQGKTQSEFIKCAEAFYGCDMIDWIGVARNIEPIAGSRRGLTRIFHSIFPDAKFHLLGFSDNVFDDIECTKHYNVQGIDSAVPLRLGHQKMSLCDEPYPGRPKDWWENATCTPETLYNVRRFRSWIQNERVYS